ncbi:hypothetical protein BDV98DRAFT_575599 [Pterulicium gracile]|uniref:Uncharacterized protein n=1 Tax=Pterulicium gracile TaxID=1884261 RepID=A0A5C3Q6W0_9AGAR|nr:hypothetical protein BDV98DRAFT_575599 [Pterula gracilis]
MHDSCGFSDSDSPFIPEAATHVPRCRCSSCAGVERVLIRVKAGEPDGLDLLSQR